VLGRTLNCGHSGAPRAGVDDALRWSVRIQHTSLLARGFHCAVIETYMELIRM
jgi:hypothetical protein